MNDLKGSIVALVTPLTKDGDFNPNYMDQLVSWHNDAATDGFVILGSTGEGTLFSSEERSQIIRSVVDHPDNRLPVWVGVSDSSPHEVLNRIQEAEEAGADGVMLSSPMYIKPSQQSIINYYTRIADHSQLPVLMYNIPSRSGAYIDVETACILSHHEKIIGIKDSVINIDRMMAYHDADDHFHVYCGDDLSKMTCLSNGGAGVISVIANVIPHLVSTFCELINHQVFYKAQALESSWGELAEGLSRMPNPTAIKWLLAQQGRSTPFMRHPIAPISFAEEEQLVLINESCQALFELTVDLDEPQ